MNLALTTSASEVVCVIDWLDARDAVYQVNGGWAVDALAGRQTRPHRDLNLFVDSEVVPPLLEWLTSRGYVQVEDWLPVRTEYASPRGRVDLHPMAVLPDGTGVQQGLGGEVFRHLAAGRTVGRIEGRAVIVATPERLRELREGYELRDVDRHDLRVLAALAGAEAPGQLGSCTERPS